MNDKAYKPRVYNMLTPEELFSEKPTKRESEDKHFALLNLEPPAEWILEHPKIPGYKYLPIDKVELLLGRIFITYNIEILREGLAFNGNGVYVVARVHYWDPFLCKMCYHDGIGAMKLESKADLQPSFPIAKTIAIKDACDHFGKVFGRDLNRNRTEIVLPELSELDLIKAMFEEVKGKLREDQIAHMQRIIDRKEQTSYKKLINTLSKIKQNEN